MRVLSSRPLQAGRISAKKRETTIAAAYENSGEDDDAAAKGPTNRGGTSCSR